MKKEFTYTNDIFTRPSGPTAKEAVIFARVSSREQSRGQSTTAQINNCKKYCEENGLIFECLDTSDSLTYNEGMCYQASRLNVVESVFVINRPINPEDAPENYQYDITWDETIRIDNFSLVDGLAGKHIMTILRMNDHILKVTFDGASTDKNATYGYLRILPNAFKAHSERATDSVLYAYIAIGDAKGLAEKPSSQNG